MKMSLNSDELDELESLSDEELVSTIRAALKGFRASRGGEDDLPQATSGTPSKGGRSESTLETPASRAANRSANDAAYDRAHRQTQRDRAIAKLIPNYDRL